MRLNELLECRIGAVHLFGKDSYIYIKGKGDKERVIPITKETNKMSADNVQRIVKKYADMAKSTDDDFPELHPHMLRHSYGAVLYRNNMSKAEIASCWVMNRNPPLKSTLKPMLI